jgi:hypothetical protein
MKHVPLISPSNIVNINCTCFRWSYQWYCQYQLYIFPFISPSDIVSINWTCITWWDQRKHVQLILTISLGEISGNMYNWYWQYHLVRSKETCTIDTDNITCWDQRKHDVSFDLTKWYCQYQLYMFHLISPSDIVSMNCTCFRWSYQVILSVSIVHFSFNVIKWYCQYQLYTFPLIYWQYHVVRSTETCTIHIDNITSWDQRKHVQLILTISLGEIKGNMYNWYW